MSGPWRIETIRARWIEYNETYFLGVLVEPGFSLMTRNRWHDGVFKYNYARTAKRVLPGPERLYIHKDNLDDEDLFHDTLLHEMVHQWQVNVLRKEALHDSEFWELLEKVRSGIPLTK